MKRLTAALLGATLFTSALVSPTATTIALNW
jgi:hypothetical protein